MTLINSRYMNELNEHGKSNPIYDKRPSFSVKGIMKLAGNYCFGQNQYFDNIHLSDIQKYDLETNFYRFCCKIMFNDGCKNLTVIKI